MSIEEMKAITRRFVEPWSNGKLDVLDELCAPNYVLGDGATLQHLKEAIRKLRKAVPDLKSEIGVMVAEGDTVAYRWAMRGTHTGVYEKLAPTGKPVKFTGITIIRFANGKIVRDEFEASNPPLEKQVA